jgi:hypothetical protein
MIVMMELVILILLKVQANHLLPSFCPIRLRHFFELDKVQTQLPIIYPHSFGLYEVQGMMHTCVVDLIRVCQETSQQIYGYGFCIFHGFEECAHPHGQSIIQESYNFLLHCLAHAEWSELQSCYLSLVKKSAKDSNVLYAKSLKQRFDKDFLIIFFYLQPFVGRQTDYLHHKDGNYVATCFSQSLSIFFYISKKDFNFYMFLQHKKNVYYRLFIFIHYKIL